MNPLAYSLYEEMPDPTLQVLRDREAKKPVEKTVEKVVLDILPEQVKPKKQREFLQESK